MDTHTTLSHFLSGQLTQVETITLLAKGTQKMNLDIRFGLESFSSGAIPVKRNIMVILKKLGIIPWKLTRISEKSAKIRKVLRNKKDKLITEQVKEKFLQQTANQDETLAILISSTRDSTIKAFINEAYKSGKLDENTTFLFKKLGVLPVIDAGTDWDPNGFLKTTNKGAGCFQVGFLF